MNEILLSKILNVEDKHYRNGFVMRVITVKCILRSIFHFHFNMSLLYIIEGQFICIVKKENQLLQISIAIENDGTYCLTI